MHFFVRLWSAIVFLLMIKTMRSYAFRTPFQGLLRNTRSSFRFSERPLSSTSSNSNYYLTTPIYYVNGDPHLGHAYTSVITDIIARYRRKFGEDVYFLTGTDEHGQKVEQSALKAKKSPSEFCNEVSGKFESLLRKLNCEHDEFIRTTEPRHKEAVVALWKQLEANNQIYLGHYEGWYSVRDEMFYSEGELIEGKAPTGADVEWVKEESYFFRLSEWKDKLLEHYEKNPNFIQPIRLRNEIINFISSEEPLRDLSISRTSFRWGIPVPGNEDKHVIYVWLDALTNYITALGYPNIQNEKFKKFWPANVHIVGKDILRFHTVFWPAFLMAAGLPLPKVSISAVLLLGSSFFSLVLLLINRVFLLMDGGHGMVKKCPNLLVMLLSQLILLILSELIT
jgi:methionyl-tRNA synthetase